jgi:hypothetical protein
MRYPQDGATVRTWNSDRDGLKIRRQPWNNLPWSCKEKTANRSSSKRWLCIRKFKEIMWNASRGVIISWIGSRSRPNLRQTAARDCGDLSGLYMRPTHPQSFGSRLIQILYSIPTVHFRSFPHVAVLHIMNGLCSDRIAWDFQVDSDSNHLIVVMLMCLSLFCQVEKYGLHSSWSVLLWLPVRSRFRGTFCDGSLKFLRNSQISIVGFRSSELKIGDQSLPDRKPPSLSNLAPEVSRNMKSIQYQYKVSTT